MPLYVLGLEGMTRRMQHYDVAEWHPWLIVPRAARADPVRHRLPGRATRRVDPQSGSAARPHRRSLGWPHARMDNEFAAAGLQLRGDAESPAAKPIGDIKQKALEHRRLTDLPDYKPIEMPRNSPTGIRGGFLCRVTGFALDLAYLVDGHRRAVGAFATFVVFAWRDHSEYELSAPNWRESITSGARLASRWSKAASPASRRSSIRSRARSAQAGAARADDGGYKGPASKRIVTGYGFWIFLLSDFILFSGFYAAYAVLSHATAGGPTPKAVRSEDGGDRDRLSAAVELRLRHGDLASNVRNMLWTQIGYFITGLPGARRFCRFEVSEFAECWRSRRRPRPQRLSFGLLCPRRPSWAAREHRPVVARNHDGAVLGQGLSCRHHAARHCASRCSGTRSTSSGSAFSPMSIFWGQAHERIPGRRRIRQRRRPRRSGTGRSHRGGVRNYLIGLVLAAGAHGRLVLGRERHEP
jgi:cytochrome o ubiquinol oxidase subunit 1